MKKILLGTTALVAATAITAPAMSAERIQLQLRGYHVGGISFTDYDATYTNFNTSSGFSSSYDYFSGYDNNEINFGSDSEVHFRGETTLDNGLRVSFRAELELEDDSDVDDDADQIDEVYVQFDGGFGRIQFGQNDGVMDQTAVTAPLIFSEHGHSDADMDPFDAYSGYGNPIDTVGDFTGDDIKLSYFTPEMNGFQLGFSYTPNPCKNDTGYSSCIMEEYARNYWEVAATWEVEVGNVGFGFSAGYGQGEQGYGAEDPTELTLGAEMTFGGFTLGGSWKDATTLGPYAAGQSDESFDIGAAYETGPWAFNVAYGQREVDYRAYPCGSSCDNDHNILEAESWIAGLTYMYGPGMQIGFGVTTLDMEDGWYEDIAPGETQGYIRAFDGTSFFIENTIRF